jgi:hypothetical protein
MRTLFIGVLNVISLIAALAFALLLFMGGAFASDSGTTAALVVSFSVMGFACLYPVLAIVAIIVSQRRRSYWIAILPLALPAALLLFAFSPWFSFS